MRSPVLAQGPVATVFRLRAITAITRSRGLQTAPLLRGLGWDHGDFLGLRSSRNCASGHGMLLSK
jgi:hypothetical protein